MMTVTEWKSDREPARQQIADECTVGNPDCDPHCDGRKCEPHLANTETESKMILPIINHLQDENRRLRALQEELLVALKMMVEHFQVGGGKVPIGKMLENARATIAKIEAK